MFPLHQYVRDIHLLEIQGLVASSFTPALLFCGTLLIELALSNTDGQSRFYTNKHTHLGIY